MLKSLRLLIGMCALFAFTVNGQNALVDVKHPNYKAYYYEDGSISSEGLLIDGKPNDYWITYYPNGLRKSEGNRANFELDSLWTFYDKAGNKANTIYYRQGLRNGISQTFDSCYVVLEENYVDNVKEGKSYWYYADSNKVLKKEVPFLKGRENGLAYTYAKDGRIVTITEYSKGYIASKEEINRKDAKGWKQGVWKDFYNNSRLKTEYRYKNDMLNGYVKNYSKAGKLISADLYIDDVLQEGAENLADFDIRYKYHSNGKVKSQTTYNLQGKKDGVRNTFDKEGKVLTTEIYRNGYLLSKGSLDAAGNRQGIWEEYYITGEIKSKGEYKDDKKFKKWVYYFRNGKVEQKGAFDKAGRISGEWNWFYESGQLLRRENFYRGVEDGEMVEYDVNGKVITEGEFLDGEKEGDWFYELNDHIEKGKYRFGLKNGTWEYHYTSGKKNFVGTFNEGVPEGKHKYYYESGKVMREENYRFGQKHGNWKWFDKEGNQTLSIYYKDGREVKIDGERVKFASE